VRRALLSVLWALVLAACSSPPAPPALVQGCSGPNGSCARYLPAVDGDGAPLDGATVILRFSAPVKVAADPPPLAFVTAAVNLATREPELRLVPVRAIRADARNPRQVTLELDGILADGAAIDLPDGLLRDGDGNSLGALTVKVNSGLSPFAVALAAVMWVPTDPSLFLPDGVERPRGAKGEAQVRQELEARLRLRPGIAEETVAAVLAQYDDATLKRKAPDHRVRAGLLMLTGTSGEPAIPFFLADTNRRGVPFEPIQVRSLREYGAFAAVFYHPLGKLQLYIDTDVAAESLEHIAVVLAHEMVHSSLGGGSAIEETLAMAADTRVYEEFLLWDPTLARRPTELTRAANRLLLALRNSGRFGYPRAGILPRPGVEDALAGVGPAPVRSFRDLLFQPHVYGDLPRAGDTGTEVLEGYYARIASTTENQGRLKYDQHTLKLFDQALDHGLTDEQILAIAAALGLRPVPKAGP
jgi:hypothetical protein